MRPWNTPRRPAVSTFVLALTALLVASFLPAGPALAQQSDSPVAYRIGPKDLVEIRVFEVPELNIERRVSEDGMINLPLVGNVPVSGLTYLELADRLKALLEARYVQRASVTVQVREYRSRPIVVMGAVRQPGTLGFSGRWSLLEVLAAVGGVAEGNGGTIYILRRSDNGLSDQVGIAVEDLIARADPDVNIPIFANDVINVPAASTVTIYCLGEVGSAGGITFNSTERITLLTAIARAGGLTDRASRRIEIKRRGDDGRYTVLEANYKRILSGRDPDIELHEDDVIVVKESFF